MSLKSITEKINYISRWIFLLYFLASTIIQISVVVAIYISTNKGVNFQPNTNLLMIRIIGTIIFLNFIIMPALLFINEVFGLYKYHKK
jgi:hypothetical protein